MPPRRESRRRSTARRTPPAVRTAAARAVERVLSSKETFALLIRRLESAGWHIERPAISIDPARDVLTSPPRAR